MDGKQELGSNLEMRVENNNDIIRIGNEDNCKEDDVMKSRINDEDMDCKFFSPKQENLDVDKEDEVELESAKARMGEMKEENERLKTILEQIENNYKSLKLSFFDILTSPNKNKPLENEAKIKEYNQDDVDDDEPEISLSLGLQTHRKPKREDSNVSNTTTTTSSKKLMSESLFLGLELVKTHPSNIDLSNKRSERSDDETTMDDNEKDDGIRESWAQSNKVLKTMKDHGHEKEGETSQPSNTKRARVSVRVRCDTPTMNDGCQWRKYGQKLAKGNPCPRAYYRCTVAPSCPVRKQVQRCSEDTSILITTYEGTHNHPLSLVATSMASTTSAAASILLSGSSTSQPGLTSPAPTTVTSTNNSLNGINFTLYNNNNNPKPTNYANQYNLPISSSPNNAPPTITLDLTSTPSTIFNKRYPSPTNYNYSSKSLDFSSSQSKITFPNIGSSSSWSNNNNYLNYSLLSSTNNNNPSSISFGKPIYESITHHHNPISNNNSSSSSSQQFLTETLAKLLTSDPSFQSAVAAAISSMVGSNNNLSNNSINTSSNNNNGANNGYNLMQNMKWGDQVQGILGNLLPNHLNNTTSSSSTSISSSSSSISQTTGNFINQHPQKLFPFTLTKNSSPPDLKD